MPFYALSARGNVPSTSFLVHGGSLICAPDRRSRHATSSIRKLAPAASALVAICLVGQVGATEMIVDSYTKGSLPIAGKPGRLARLTDDVRGLWMDTGSAWVPLNGQILNALEFGVTVGDRVELETVNNQALVNFFKAVAGNPPYEGRLPCGIVRYTIGQVVGANGHDYPRVSGCGGGIWDPGISSPTHNTVLKYYGSGVALTVVARGASLSEFQIVGTGAALAGIQLTQEADIAGLSFRDLTIAGFTNPRGHGGMFVNPGRFITTSNFYNLAFTNNQDGVQFIGTTGTTIRFYGCSWTGNARYGIYASSQSDVVLYNPVFQSNGADAIRLAVGTGGTIRHWTLHAPYFENNNRLVEGHDVDVRGGNETTDMVDELVLDHPQWSGRGRFQAGMLRLENVRDVEIRNPWTGGGYTTEPSIVRAGRVEGLWVTPHDNTKSSLGQLIAQFHALCPGTIKALWVFGSPDSRIADFSGLGHEAKNSITAGYVIHPVQKHAPRAYLYNGETSWEAQDHGDFSFGDGVRDSPMSLVALINPNARQNHTVVAKADSSSGRSQLEWEMGLDNEGSPYFVAYDDRSKGRVGRRHRSPILSNAWSSVIATKGSGPFNEAVGLFLNGQADHANLGSGTYASMQDKGAKVASYSINAAGAKAGQFDGQVAIIAILAEELTLGKIVALDALLRGYAGAL